MVSSPIWSRRRGCANCLLLGLPALELPPTGLALRLAVCPHLGAMEMAWLVQTTVDDAIPWILVLYAGSVFMFSEQNSNVVQLHRS
jgi:hypothetical protein